MTKTKICGIKSADAMEAALTSGADFLGLVFFPKSPRNVCLREAGELAALARKDREPAPKIVALLVDADDDQIDDVIKYVNPDILQLHGRETIDRVQQIKKRSQKAVWKAVGVASAENVATAQSYGNKGGADAILFDARPPADSNGMPGGNGLTFDWRILDGQSREQEYILAGGLTPQNVARAIKLLSPAIVDVSSGVERAPGEKDATLIRDFIEAVRSAKQKA